MSIISEGFEGLRQSTQKRLNAAHSGKTRVVIQSAHCSLSVGAGEVAEALASSLPDDAYLVVAGCDGACFAAPQVSVTYPSGEHYGFPGVSARSVRSFGIKITPESRPPQDNSMDFFNHQRRVALDMCGELDATGIDDYIARGGYAGLARALSMQPEGVIEQVKESGLRGRGGAYFPAALKWQGARAINTTPRYLVVNSEEGEPGIFKDRHIMEGVPHRMLEGTIIAAYASDVHDAYIYINAEANLSAERVERAIEQAYERGLLGENILGSGYSLNVEIRRGAGGYVCGEETTLLNTMEGYRREPRLRPPFPTEAGLWAKPTIINNTETLASVPFILVNGAKAYAEIGTESDKGTKIISLSGSVRRPGIAEVPMGTTLWQIIYDIGGGPPEGHTITAMAVGGPSSGVFPASMLDTPIKPGFIHESGVMLGAGGVIALDERVSLLDVVRNLAAYNARESCGKCTPCREGTPRMVEMIDRLASGKASVNDLEDMRQLAQLVNAASLCGLGQAAGNPVLSALHFFGDELAMRAGVAE
jgi:NADH:ubiquinone oxidoreductase subunit F (NADH-binding)